MIEGFAVPFGAAEELDQWCSGAALRSDVAPVRSGVLEASRGRESTAGSASPADSARPTCGDWWNYGEHRYGERAAIVAEGTLGYSYQTCRDAGWVATSIPMSRRRDSLTWSHHREVAALRPDEQGRS